MRIGAIYTNIQLAQRSMRGHDPPSARPRANHITRMREASTSLCVFFCSRPGPTSCGLCASPKWRLPAHLPYAISHLPSDQSPFTLAHLPLSIHYCSQAIAHCLYDSFMELSVGDVYRRNLCEHLARPALYAGSRFSPSEALCQPHHRCAWYQPGCVRVSASTQRSSLAARAQAPNG